MDETIADIAAAPISVSQEQTASSNQFMPINGKNGTVDYSAAPPRLVSPLPAIDEDADEELWQKTFAETSDLIITMADEAERSYKAGLTWSIDPKTK